MAKKIKKVKQPRDLIIQGHLIAFCTYDRKGLRSVRFYDPNRGEGTLMGSRSATTISKWMAKAADWVRARG